MLCVVTKLDRAKMSDHVTGERFSAETRVAKRLVVFMLL